ncbi:MAG TPA: hypothetical protein PLU87_08425 [Sedimentisphaerales bacterium]|nr:hypothetical protein [Sedimentisphaerales bacterium]HRS10813.1 hypothetical protein [Sedimentisphaerales bacterium]HRV47519.1 hypothetical protein [Sedimentisphaerales bacterium]
MRFLALLRKELRESLPWLLLAGLLLLGVGLLALRAQVRFTNQGYWSYHPGMGPGEDIAAYRLVRNSRLAEPALWLAFIAPGLGLVLGVSHFWVPLFARTWSFLLHRSTSRMSILGAKLGAAILGFLISLGLVWTGLYWYACRPGVFPIPEPIQILVAGWIYIAMGLVVYLGTALSALSTARWYTTRIFGLAFATLAVFVMLVQWHLGWVFVLAVPAIAILLVQTVAAFLSREF